MVWSKQAPVVQRLDNPFHRINRYPNKTNHANRWKVIYPVDGVIRLLNNLGQYFSCGSVENFNMFARIFIYKHIIKLFTAF